MQREKYIDAAKGIGIFLVIYAHVINRNNLSDLSGVVDVIYAFHMPLFFLISGYCAGLKKDFADVSFLKQTKKLFIRLMVPYFVWSFVYMYIGGALENAERYKAVFTLRGIAPLWFLATLFMCEVFFYAVLCLTGRLSDSRRICIFAALGGMSILAGFALFCIKAYFGLSTQNPGVASYYIFVTIARFFVSLPAFVFGYIFAKSGVIRRIGKLWCLFGGVVFLGCVVLAVVFSGLSVNCHTFEISNYWIFTVVSVFGAVGILMLSYSVEKFSNFLSFMGENSLALMILHYIPFKAIEYSAGISTFIWNNQIFVSLFATALTIGISLVGIYLVKKKFFLYK